MRSLLDNLAESTQKRTAIGHFNISDLVGLNAVAAAARRMGVRVRWLKLRMPQVPGTI